MLLVSLMATSEEVYDDNNKKEYLPVITGTFKAKGQPTYPYLCNLGSNYFRDSMFP